MNAASEIWKSVLEILHRTLTDTAMQTWFSESVGVDIRDDKYFVYSPSDFKRGIIQSRMTPLIKDALHELLAADFDIIVLNDEEYRRYSAAGGVRNDITEAYTFETFVVGASNKFAHAAAMNVAYQNDPMFNPLFIYGNSGLGKTHLLLAIRHVIRYQHPEYNIVYVKGEEFLNELIEAIQMNKTSEFREKYRYADIFLMDDIHFIAGKVAVQEEFFHTFNSLYESGKRIVFTSDRPPEEMPRLEDRLRSRLMSSLIVDVQTPDHETRMAILRKKAYQSKMNLPNDVCDFIATQLTSNIRQLEGAIKKIQAHCDIMDVSPESLTVQELATVLKDMFKTKMEYIPTPDEITDATAKYFLITPDEVRGKRRTRNTAQARQIAMYLIRSLTTLSLNDIGKYFDRDHTTVLTSIRKIEDDMKFSAEVSAIVRDILANLNSKH